MKLKATGECRGMSGIGPAFTLIEVLIAIGILALADVIVVTEDSVSMTSEALATGKPVYDVRLPGYSARLRRFQDDLIAEGYTRPFTGALERWNYTPPDDTARAALMCRQRFGWK